MRIIHQGKLHRVCDGAPTEPSKEQDWKIHKDYYNARYRDKAECEIDVCDCSYPVFWSFASCIKADGEPTEVWRPVTCLSEDHGREIDNCPNCGAWLKEGLEEEEDIWEEAPEPCKGCKYYSDNYVMTCAVHPYGPDDDICPDYSM